MPDFSSVSAFGSSRTACLHTRSACLPTNRKTRLSLRKRRTKHVALVVPLARLLAKHLHSLEMLTLPPAERQMLHTSLAPLEQALLHARRIAAPTKASPSHK